MKRQKLEDLTNQYHHLSHNLKPDSPNKDFNASFTGINLLNSKIYGNQMTQIQHKKADYTGNVSDIIRNYSAVYDMKELLNNYITGIGKEEEPQFD